MQEGRPVLESESAQKQPTVEDVQRSIKNWVEVEERAAKAARARMDQMVTELSGPKGTLAQAAKKLRRQEHEANTIGKVLERQAQRAGIPPMTPEQRTEANLVVARAVLEHERANKAKT